MGPIDPSALASLLALLGGLLAWLAVRGLEGLAVCELHRLGGQHDGGDGPPAGRERDDHPPRGRDRRASARAGRVR